MRIAMFGTIYPLSLVCLEALLGEGHALMFIMADIPWKRKLKQAILNRRPGTEQFAHERGIATLRYTDEDKCAAALKKFAPDVICIATFPKLIPPRFGDLAPLGMVNLHPSLLPRHRGTNPLFWTYYHGDLATGITVHRAIGRFDAGAIIAQRTLPLPRGYPNHTLRDDIMSNAGAVMVEAVGSLAAGGAERLQDEALATKAPRVDLSLFRAPIEEWDVAQSWHFLTGLCASFKQPLQDADGVSISYGSVGPFRRMPHTQLPGHVERSGAGWQLYCPGGIIALRP